LWRRPFGRSRATRRRFRRERWKRGGPYVALAGQAQSGTPCGRIQFPDAWMRFRFTAARSQVHPSSRWREPHATSEETRLPIAARRARSWRDSVTRHAPPTPDQGGRRPSRRPNCGEPAPPAALIQPTSVSAGEQVCSFNADDRHRKPRLKCCDATSAPFCCDNRATGGTFKCPTIFWSSWESHDGIMVSFRLVTGAFCLQRTRRRPARAFAHQGDPSWLVHGVVSGFGWWF
jgi:hypothetical protein